MVTVPTSEAAADTLHVPLLPCYKQSAVHSSIE
jgi:hypothetical protein